MEILTFGGKMALREIYGNFEPKLNLKKELDLKGRDGVV
jgi:hypothetical protein